MLNVRRCLIFIYRNELRLLPTRIHQQHQVISKLLGQVDPLILSSLHHTVAIDMRLKHIMEECEQWESVGVAVKKVFTSFWWAQLNVRRCSFPSQPFIVFSSSSPLSTITRRCAWRRWKNALKPTTTRASKWLMDGKRVVLGCCPNGTINLQPLILVDITHHHHCHSTPKHLILLKMKPSCLWRERLALYRVNWVTTVVIAGKWCQR